MKPGTEHAAVKINRPLHHNGTLTAASTLLLWSEAMAKG
jgi:hypothetical protein